MEIGILCPSKFLIVTLFFASLLCPSQFGYGDKFIDMLEIVYDNIHSKTEINGVLSDPFTIIGGVCEGYPLSISSKWQVRQ